MHLAFFVTNFELAGAWELYSKTFDFDVGGDFRRDAVRHRVDDVGRSRSELTLCAWRTRAAMVSHPTAGIVNGVFHNANGKPQISN